MNSVSQQLFKSKKDYLEGRALVREAKFGFGGHYDGGPLSSDSTSK